ncbi:MAG: PfkB family carbohydrate kinase [Kiloniellales bacterium]|nr:PfkB family carbohydrate kinase [Kiloniellales bacterium]
MHEEPDVVCFGAAHWDVIARAQAEAPGPDTPGRVERRPGGVALNVARALAAAGCRATLVAPLGDDEDGRRLRSVLAAEDIEAEASLGEGQAPTGCYVAVERADGELLTAVADAAALDALTPADLPLDRLSGAQAWFFETNLPRPVIEALAGRAGRPALIADAVSPAKAPKLGPVLGRLATLYCNRAEAEAICAKDLATAEAAARALLELGVGRAVVTDGPGAAADAGRHGVTVLHPEGDGLRSVTGAGDALIAAHLATTLKGGDPEAALAAGLAAARRLAA